MKESNCRIQNTLTPKVISASIYVYIDEVMHLESKQSPENRTVCCGGNGSNRTSL